MTSQSSTQRHGECPNSASPPTAPRGPKSIKLPPKPTKKETASIATLAIVAFVLFSLVGAAMTVMYGQRTITSRSALDCLCYDDTVPKPVATAVLSTYNNPRNLGFVASGTAREVEQFASELFSCRSSSSSSKMWVMPSGQWSVETFSEAVKSTLPCRMLVVPQVKDMPVAIRSQLKGVLDHASWDGVVTEGSLSIVIGVNPSGLDPRTTSREEAFSWVLSQKLFDDRVVHLMTSVILS